VSAQVTTVTTGIATISKAANAATNETTTTKALTPVGSSQALNQSATAKVTTVISTTVASFITVLLQSHAGPILTSPPTLTITRTPTVIPMDAAKAVTLMTQQIPVQVKASVSSTVVTVLQNGPASAPSQGKPQAIATISTIANKILSFTTEISKATCNVRNSNTFQVNCVF
jgi:hypothetical protein